MNGQKNILFATLLVVSSSINYRLEGWSFSFDEFDEKVEQQLKQARDSMRTMGKQFKYAFSNVGKNRQVTLDIKDNSMRITIPDVEGDAIEAHFDDSQKANNIQKLTITASQLKATIMARHNFIALELLEEDIITEKEDGKESQFVSTSVNHINQTAPRELLLAQQAIEYDQENKKLTVIIPMKEEYKGKPVPITKVNKSKK